jgi:Putative porin
MSSAKALFAPSAQHAMRRVLLLCVLASGMATATAPTWAAESEVDKLRATTTKLINLLLEQGLLTRAKAEELLAEVQAAATPPPAPTTGATAPTGTVRVPFIPLSVRNDLKEELRGELAAQALREGWAGPGVVPPWVRGMRMDGDLRTRFQADNFNPQNAPALNINETNRTRVLTLQNTTTDRQRLRVRARLGATVTADDNWGAGLRLTTGSVTDPISSNQTQGNYGNRFTAAFDRAFVRYRYGDEVNAVAGRFGNPWFSTDLVWANDLGFDGLALQWTPRLFSGVRGFVTGAVMPVQEAELSARDKWMFGLQMGADFQGSGLMAGRLGLAYYHYRNTVGVPNAPTSSLNDSTAPAFAQKGNTYFNISTDPTRPLLALASDYHIINLTGSLDILTVGDRRLVFTGDLAKNIGFKRTDVSARVGSDVAAETKAYQMRVAFGDRDVNARHQWQTFFGYKYVQRDAVLDAFTDSDLRLGGTDAKGYSLGGSYGLGKNSALTLRWLSADSISGPPLSVDVMQLDLSVRF